MDLKTYFQSHNQVDCAKQLGVTPGAVNQWVSGARPVPVKFAVAIESATNKQVTRKDLFPNDWQQIWPELAQTPTETAQAAIKNIPPTVPNHHDADHDAAGPAGLADCQVSDITG